MFEILKKNVHKLKKSLKGQDVTVVCASKYYEAKTMRLLYGLGITHFGESRADELLKKQKQLKDLNITWHFIGSLQSNKVKKIINKITYLHSLERMSLIKAIQKERKEPLKCFIQMNLANEKTKSGLNEEQLATFYQNIKKYDKIIPIGLMQMGVYDDRILTENIYKKTSKINNEYNFKDLSMGMSADYLIAVNNGATFIRVGSLFKNKEIKDE